MSNRRLHHTLLVATFVAVAPVLAGCADFDTDKLDIFGLSEKKKLPGERKPLFPEGVPGVTQGIPPEYMKGNQPQPESAQAAPTEPVSSEPATPPKQTAAVAPAEKPKAEKPKPKPKRTAAKPKPKPPASNASAQPASQQQPMAPWPEPGQQAAPQQSQSPWPAPDQNAAPAPWPSAPPPGTFSR